MVYLAGYGLQLAGDNYFVPVNSAINRDTDVPIEACGPATTSVSSPRCR